MNQSPQVSVLHLTPKPTETLFRLEHQINIYMVSHTQQIQIQSFKIHEGACPRGLLSVLPHP